MGKSTRGPSQPQHSKKPPQNEGEGLTRKDYIQRTVVIMIILFLLASALYLTQ